MSGRLTIQQKIISSFIVLLLAFAVIVNAVFINRFSAQSQSENEQGLNTVFQSLQAEIDNRATTASAIAETMATTPSMQEAFAYRDRQALLKQAGPVMQRVKQQYGVKQLQFHLPDSHSFLRAHKPEKFGDDLSGFRHTVNQANTDKAPATGIEIGVAGIGIRGVVPVQWNGRHLGTVETGLSLNDQFLESMKQRYGVNVAIYLMRDGQLKVHAETSATPVSTDTMQAVINGSNAVTGVTGHDSSTLMTRTEVLTDFQGKSVGVMIISKDISAAIAAQNGVIKSIILITLGILVISGIAGTLIARSISRPLGAEPREMSQLSKRVAQGELDIPEPKGQLVGVYKSLFDMITNLKTTVSKVSQSASIIAEKSEHMRQSADNLRHRTLSQSESVQSTAESMQEITSTMEQTADNARSASELASQLASQAKNGGTIVDSVVQAMKDISTSSAKATDIITAIDEIAFQTNLLALNAAVEAARAGESGRGFAVVASEVRALSQRSASAARDIKALIENSYQNVQKGSALVNDAGQSLNDILGSVSELNQIISAIALANEEQSIGVGQINNSISTIDQNTDTDSELAQDTSNMASELAHQAEQLQSLMAHFRTSSSSQISQVPRVSPASQSDDVVATQSRRKKPLPAPVSDIAKPTNHSLKTSKHDDLEWSQF